MGVFALQCLRGVSLTDRFVLQAVTGEEDMVVAKTRSFTFVNIL